MAQTVTINKASYPDVPYVLLNKTDGTGQAKYVDSSDATATSDVIQQGQSAYVNGEKVEGSVPATSSLLIDSDVASERNNFDARFTSTVATKTILNAGATVIQDVPLEDFGSAAAANVLQGYSFTSRTGLRINGSIETLDFTEPEQADDITETSEGIEIRHRLEKGYTGDLGATITLNIANQDLANEIGLTSANLSPSSSVLGITGTYTTDATASAADIAKDKTAYINGAKVTGTLENLTAAGSIIVDAQSGYTTAADIKVTSGFQWNEGDRILRNGDDVYLSIPNSEIVTATGLTANDLAVGVKHLGISGTYTSDATATASDIMTGKTAYVNGEKITGTMALATSEQIQDMFNSVFGAA